jgi:hypothetical protein
MGAEKSQVASAVSRCCRNNHREPWPERLLISILTIGMIIKFLFLPYYLLLLDNYMCGVRAAEVAGSAAAFDKSSHSLARLAVGRCVSRPDGRSSLSAIKLSNHAPSCCCSLQPRKIPPSLRSISK